MLNYLKVCLKFFFLPSIFILIVLSIATTSCQKELEIEDYPNLLLNLKLSKTGNANEIRVYLSTSHNKVNYSFKNQNNNYRILSINNTFKSSKLSNIAIDGLEDYLENCKAIQISQKNNTNNPIVTKIIFKIKDPKVQIVVKIKPKQISISRLNKIVNESESASAIVASKMNSPTITENNLYLIEFFGIIVVIIIIIWVFSKYEST